MRLGRATFGAIVAVTMGLAFNGASVRAATVLDFNDVSPGTLTVFSPYQSQGFTLVSSSGGWVFNSPDTGNGFPQTVGSKCRGERAGGVCAGDHHLDANRWGRVLTAFDRPGAGFRF